MEVISWEPGGKQVSNRPAQQAGSYGRSCNTRLVCPEKELSPKACRRRVIALARSPAWDCSTMSPAVPEAQLFDSYPQCSYIPQETPYRYAQQPLNPRKSRIAVHVALMRTTHCVMENGRLHGLGSLTRFVLLNVFLECLRASVRRSLSSQCCIDLSGMFQRDEVMFLCVNGFRDRRFRLLQPAWMTAIVVRGHGGEVSCRHLPRRALVHLSPLRHICRKWCQQSAVSTSVWQHFEDCNFPFI